MLVTITFDHNVQTLHMPICNGNLRRQFPPSAYQVVSQLHACLNSYAETRCFTGRNFISTDEIYTEMGNILNIKPQFI